MVVFNTPLVIAFRTPLNVFKKQFSQSARRRRRQGVARRPGRARDAAGAQPEHLGEHHLHLPYHRWKTLRSGGILFTICEQDAMNRFSSRSALIQPGYSPHKFMYKESRLTQAPPGVAVALWRLFLSTWCPRPRAACSALLTWVAYLGHVRLEGEW